MSRKRVVDERYPEIDRALTEAEVVAMGLALGELCEIQHAKGMRPHRHIALPPVQATRLPDDVMAERLRALLSNRQMPDNAKVDVTLGELRRAFPADEYVCGECGHDQMEHVHYCSHEEATGSCNCNAEYARVPSAEREAPL